MLILRRKSLWIKINSLFEHSCLVIITKFLLLFNSTAILKKCFVPLYTEYFIVISI